MKTLKVLSTAAIAGLGIAALASCGGSKEKAITFYNTCGQNLQTKISEAIEAFEAKYGWKVESTQIGGYDDVYSTCIAGLSANAQPNIAYAYSDHVAAYIQSGKVLDLNQFIDSTKEVNGTKLGYTADEKADFVKGYYDEGLAKNYDDYSSYGFTENSMLTMPFSKSTELMYVNVTAMKAAGVETIPTTWDEMWELGDKAKEEGIYLFTYPTTGYFDAFFYALMYAAGGSEFFDKATNYEEGIWETPEAQTCFDIVAKLAEYTNPITPAQANDQDFTQNQQLVLDNKAIFMPNGTWIVGEMADAPRADGFKWGMTALPAVKAGGDSYSYTWFEQAWIPSGAEHQDAAKLFISYLYSDKACEIFAKAGAIQPVLGIADKLEGDNVMFYSIYDNGAKAAMGNFASFEAIPGIEVRTVFFDPVNSLVSGDMTEQEWIDGIISASDQMRANLK